jgi:hypothetical protein
MRNIPQRKKRDRSHERLFQFWIPAELLPKIRVAAAREDMQMAPWIRQLILNHLEKSDVITAS